MIQVIDLPNGTSKLSKSVKQLYDEIQALSAGQKTNIWTDISTNLKYFANGSFNEGSIATMHYAATFTGISGATLTAARSIIVALYVQDNPLYLINPTFDTSVNIPGYNP